MDESEEFSVKRMSVLVCLGPGCGVYGTSKTEGKQVDHGWMIRCPGVTGPQAGIPFRPNLQR